MAISKLLYVNNSKKGSDGIKGCMMGSSDCMFLVDGNCSAEWCVFSQLPKILNNTREIECMICGKEKTKVSVLSGQSIYICPKCVEKLRRLIENAEQ